MPSAERQRDVALRVFDLAGGEGDVVPGVRGEERVRLRDADADEQARSAVDGGQSRGPTVLQVAAQRPEVAEVGRDRAPAFQPDDDAEHDQRDERAASWPW